LSVEAQDGSSDTTLELYRRAISLRHSLDGALTLEWVEAAPDVVHFERPGGWHCITNLGDESVDLPAGRVVLASDRTPGGKLSPDVTAWVSASTDGQ